MVSSKKKHKFKSSKEKQKPATNKRGRLIIRNLPFKVTEEALRNHFSSFGSINDSNVLKKPDGKLVGCGFIQFDRRQSAAKAIHHLSGKPFMGRPIIVDWAVPKKKFGTVKKSEPTQLSTEIKEEPLDDELIKQESDDVESDEESNNVESDEEFEDVKESTQIKEEPEEEKRPRPLPSHDIDEGKTVFLKNVPFNCTSDELKAFMEKIGPVYYAVICVDPVTEHSKGTAFVKFRNQTDASKCTEGRIDLNFKNHDLHALPALHRKDLNRQDERRHPDKKKDSRNLYLIKEGVVIPGTKAAAEVSMSDMKKRLELEAWKSNILKNLNMFISPTRLIIHNLPPSYDDKMLRTLFKKHAPPKSKIIEAKVMKNMRQLDSNNCPTSKGYGFVTFTTHEHALAALRSINNNPQIFNKNKRPIVAFSVENRVVHKIRQKRKEKSQLNNALCPSSKKPKVEEKSDSWRTKKKKGNVHVPTFTGMEAHPNTTVKFTSKSKISGQTALHKLNIGQSKKETKKKRILEEIRKEKKREPKVRTTKKKDQSTNEKEFNELVAKYRQKLDPNISAKKWYET